MIDTYMYLYEVRALQYNSYSMLMIISCLDFVLCNIPYKTNKETTYIIAQLFTVQKARAKVKAYNSKLYLCTAVSNV